METIAFIVLAGTGATAIVDLWSLARRLVSGLPLADYALVGRWIGHLARGRLRHDSIRNAAPVRGELAIGWSAHYLIGIAFAALPPALWGAAWMRAPKLGPALIVGVATVAAPFFVMQPGMGLGIAAGRTSRPNAARFQSLMSHVVFGLGLYAGAVAATGVGFGKNSASSTAPIATPVDATYNHAYVPK